MAIPLHTKPQGYPLPSGMETKASCSRGTGSSTDAPGSNPCCLRETEVLQAWRPGMTPGMSQGVPPACCHSGWALNPRGRCIAPAAPVQVLSTWHWYQPPQPGACIPTRKYQIKGILETQNPLIQAKVLLFTPLPSIPPGFGRQLYHWGLARPLAGQFPKPGTSSISRALLLSLSQSFFKYPCETASLSHTWALLTCRHLNVFPHGHHSTALGTGISSKPFGGLRTWQSWSKGVSPLKIQGHEV